MKKYFTKGMFVFGILLVLGGCTTMGTIAPVMTETDSFTGQVTTMAQLPTNFPTRLFVDESVFGFLYHAKQGSQEEVWLGISFHGKDWLFIQQGESLALRIDGGPIQVLKTYDEIIETNVYGGGLIRESPNYPVTREWVKAFAAASKVEARLQGQHTVFTFEFMPEAFENATELCRRVGYIE